MYHYLKIAEGKSEADATSPILPKWRPRMDVAWQAFMGLSQDEINAAR